MDKLQLKQEWVLGAPLGDPGGFGRVFEASSAGSPPAVAKLFPKEPGAERELLFPHRNARNVVPVLDSGEYGSDWAIVMPRAEKSLLKHLQDANGPLSVEETVKVMRDVSVALSDLEGKVVHRDLKPANILLLDGTWCLADFGLARFADATTAQHTWKEHGTSPYIAPERWRMERATIASDVYSLGVIAYELLTGQLPFRGPDFRDQHLHSPRPRLAGQPSLLAALVEECLLIAAQARPAPGNIGVRLDRFMRTPLAGGLAALAEAEHWEISQRAEEGRRMSADRTDEERRKALFSSAQSLLTRLSETVLAAFAEAAPGAEIQPRPSAQWTLRLGPASLSFGAARMAPATWRSGDTPPFDAIADAHISLQLPLDHRGCQGRSHSLWYCDAQTEGTYKWFETAFMYHPTSGKRSVAEPFSFPPRPETRAALSLGTDLQVAWPFAPLEVGDLDDFISRWANWLAQAVKGQLNWPSQMPEFPTEGSWR